MKLTIDFLISSEPKSSSFKKFSATEYKASYGQAWNQSITVQLTNPGNLRALTLKSPTGEKHNAICKFFFTFPI